MNRETPFSRLESPTFAIPATTGQEIQNAGSVFEMKHCDPEFTVGEAESATESISVEIRNLGDLTFNKIHPGALAGSYRELLSDSNFTLSQVV